ncbi:MAG: ATP-grasp domain-containing protein [Treponema sp.]|nr:ATP-grasp domain-containing protein [Treponema sp.]
MKIVIYNTNSYDFNGNLFHYENFPSNIECWKKTLKNYETHEVIFYTQSPSLFLVDFINDVPVTERLIVKFVEKNLDADSIAKLIQNENPDLVIAASFWIAPFDWLCIKDCLIGEKLKKMGIRTVCHSVDFAYACFNKYETQKLLKFHNFNAAEGILVDHELFWAERNRPEVLENVYKQTVFSKIKEMKYPLVIKDTCGLSSYGMEVVKTFGAAKNFLCSKKNNGDKIVEELIEGLQFGTEIYAYENEVFVCDPFIFSVNQYGITSPKQSVKIGPVNGKRFRIDELKKELLRLSKELKLNGTAQVDLVFNQSEKKWYIIEINPRLSGMTQTVCSSFGISASDLLMSFVDNRFSYHNQKYTAAIKFELLNEDKIQQLKKLPFVKQINQTKNDAAKQKRECGYCELILGNAESLTELEANLILLKEKFPDIMEEVFFYNSMNLIKNIKD